MEKRNACSSQCWGRSRGHFRGDGHWGKQISRWSRPVGFQSRIVTQQGLFVENREKFRLLQWFCWRKLRTRLFSLRRLWRWDTTSWLFSSVLGQPLPLWRLWGKTIITGLPLISIQCRHGIPGHLYPTVYHTYCRRPIVSPICISNVLRR